MRSAAFLASTFVFLAHVWTAFGGDAQPGRAEVRAVKGSATVSTNGAGPALPLRPGAVLHSSAIIKTAAASSVDLFLGRSAGIVRVAENSTLALDQLTLTPTGADTAVDVQLNLSDGEMYFDVNKLSKASRYEIKLPTGVAGIRGTRGCLSAQRSGNGKPPIVLLQGKLFFVQVSGGGELASHVLSAPPAVYFSATEGIKEAPPQMLQQVEQELREAKKQANKKGGGQAKAAPSTPPLKQSAASEPFLSPGSGTRNRDE